MKRFQRRGQSPKPAVFNSRFVGSLSCWRVNFDCHWIASRSLRCLGVTSAVRSECLCERLPFGHEPRPVVTPLEPGGVKFGPRGKPGVIAGELPLPFDGFGFLARFGAAPAVPPILPLKALLFGHKAVPTVWVAIEPRDAQVLPPGKSGVLAGELLLPLDRFGFLVRLGEASPVPPESPFEGIA